MTKSGKAYMARIQQETGRTVLLVSLPCGMCSGVGGNGWESTCSACDGTGETAEFIYSDCRCRTEVPGDDCELCNPETETDQLVAAA